MRSGLFLPLFDDLADPALFARLASQAESAGWDRMFVWDRLHWIAPVVDVADPWITLTAITTATERIRLGPMVTRLARRRPAKVARETATLDRLSDGRLTPGVGLGSDSFGVTSFSPARNSTRGGARRRSMSRSRSSWPPGRASWCTIEASSTRSTACASYRRRFSGRGRVPVGFDVGRSGARCACLKPFGRPRR